MDTDKDFEANSGTEDIVELLKQLAAYKRFQLAERYAKQYFDPEKTYMEHINEEQERKMELLSCVVESFFPSDIATLVHLHYINNIPVEECAECMYISRASAYRLLKKAHTAINNRYRRIV